MFAMELYIYIHNSGTLSNFCVKFKKSAIEPSENLTGAFGDANLSRNMVFMCHKVFKECRKSVEDEPHSGRPI